jgi:altronate dehydratase small subunit
MKILEKKTGKKIPKISLPTCRPPLIPVSLGTLASDKKMKNLLTKIAAAAAIVIKETDNVATATRELKAGNKLNIKIGNREQKIVIRSDIKFLHKFALESIKKGQHVIKYGQVIGEATRDIQSGEHVHIHNLRSLRGQTSE